jgi:hypothetical protein
VGANAAGELGLGRLAGRLEQADTVDDL